MNSKVNIFKENECKKRKIQDGDIVLIQYTTSNKELLMKVSVESSRYIKLISLSNSHVFIVDRHKYSELDTDSTYMTVTGTNFDIIGICDIDIKIKKIIK